MTERTVPGGSGDERGGPFMLKGVTRIDDAKRAVDAGVTAISVSNHGGNNMDGTPATIRLLPTSRTPSVTRSRCSWTAASAAASTW
jgi:isopentenyl diphosphate isomerase/L-lactate dehydrogenase-like FMN-dependent dehydrogenase